MKAAVLYSLQDIRIEDIPRPELQPGSALIKTKTCGICSGDVMPWYIEKKAPLVPGHEPCGVIVELSPELKRADPLINEGDRVFVHHHAPCMHCHHCLRGDFVQCQSWRNSKIIPGGIAEYILIPEINLRKDTLILSDTMTYEEGAMIEPIACVVKSLRRAQIKKGDTLFVLGLGVMGLLHVILAREFGAGHVIGADKVPYRLQKALEFGADHVIDISSSDTSEALSELTKGRMAEIVIVCPNSLEAIQTGLRIVASGGTVLLFTPALPEDQLSIRPNDLYFRDISLVTSYSCGPNDTRMAFDFIYRGIVKPLLLITHRFGIDQTPEAFALVAKSQDSLKVVINL
jgi:L-iditol 2-dehydrogenase